MNSSVSKFQQQFYAYISTFDGNKKDFWHPDIQSKFNGVMHQSYAGIDTLKLIHANLFALGSKAVSFNCQRMSADVFFVKFRLVNGKTDVTIEQLINTQEARVVQTSPGVDDAYLLNADDYDDVLPTAKSMTHARYQKSKCESPRSVACISKPNILTYRHRSHADNDDVLSSANSRARARSLKRECQSQRPEPDDCMFRPNVLTYRHKSEGMITTSQIHHRRM
mmetsp:Transcript_10542/g.21053  ORF Transcript_10542/g.21053 Transcript_10542/m.21053 type:complete len:223 (-) Transcript_10542:94-762(-)